MCEMAPIGKPCTWTKTCLSATTSTKNHIWNGLGSNLVLSMWNLWWTKWYSGVSKSTSFCSCQYHSTNAPYSYFIHL